MNRYEQRKQKRLMSPEIAEGYREMAAEFRLIQAIEEIRVARHIEKIQHSQGIKKRLQITWIT